MGNYLLLCALLHVPIHLLASCCDSLHIMLKFLAYVHEIINVKAMTNYVICHLETFLYTNGS